MPAARTRVKEFVMKTHDVHRYRMLVRIREFGAAHRDRFPAAGPAAQLFAAVSKAVDQLSTFVDTQAAGQDASRGGALSKAAARDGLNQALDAIARTARAFATAGLGGTFYLPSARNDHELATTARRFAQDAGPLKAQFVAHGLAKSFVGDLEATLGAFERAAQDRLAAREATAGAAAGIGATMEQALAALTRLDAIVANTLRGEPTLLAAWTAARRVARVRTSGGREPVSPTPPAPAASVKMPDTAEAA
jgi:hypothetical protein